MFKSFGPLLLIAGLVWPAVGNGQERAVWSFQMAPRGWIGVTVSFEGHYDDGVETSIVTVTEVLDGSPAAEAGIQVGDVLTHIDGRPVTQQFFSSLPNTLNPGDLLELVVNRDGEAVEISVEAVERQTTLTLHEPDIERMVITLDTIRGAIIRNLESLSVTIEDLNQEEGQARVGINLLRLPSSNTEFPEGAVFKLREAPDSLGDTWRAFIVDPEFSMPFQAFLVDSGEAVTLNQERLKVRTQLNEVRRQERSREQQIRAAIQGNAESYLATDELLQELKAREMELVATQEELIQRLRRIQEEHLQQEWAEVRARSSDAFAEAQRERTRIASRAVREGDERVRRDPEDVVGSVEWYRSPIIVGQDFILGADVKPLTPVLTEITSAREGVVVYQVPPGTPAAELGLKDMDVIVRAGGETIRSIRDLRAVLEVFERPLRLTVVRIGEDEPVEIVLRR